MARGEEPGKSHAQAPTIGAVQAASRPIRNPDLAVVSASNLFGFDLLKDLLKSNINQNLVISSVSINLALSMTADGASGDTKNSMLKTLRLSNVSSQAVRDSHESILRLLKSGDRKVTISVANSIWADQATPFKPGFLSNNQRLYDAEIRSVDFSKPDTVSSINAWVARKTHGKIPEIVTNLSPQAKMLILNAVYFKGLWFSPFTETNTKRRDFTLLTGQTKKISMMEDTRGASYLKGDGFQSVRLGYGGENRFELWLFLSDAKPGSFPVPWQDGWNKKSYEDFLNRVTHSDWKSLEKSFGYELVHIVLPRFKVEMTKKLNENLKEMGMSIAFDKHKADFSEMVQLKPEQRANIEEVMHTTFIEVNEKGTEAAAATTVVMGVHTCGTVRNPPTPKEFIVDHPFLLGIRDSDSGVIVFLGSIVDPS